MIETFSAVLPSGITLSCRASGRRGAPVLLFLHGFPEAAFVWDELLENFGDRYRCVAPNLRGFEKSSAPPEPEAYRVKHLMSDLDGLIAVRELGATRCRTSATAEILDNTTLAGVNQQTARKRRSR